MELATRHGIDATDPALALRAAREACPALITELAGRIAVGLAAVTCVLDPELIVIGGPVGVAGGPELADAVAIELAGLTVRPPVVAPSAITGNPVAAGAIQTALATGRQRILDNMTT